MKSLKRLGRISALAIVSFVLAGIQSKATSISGTFYGETTITVTTFILGAVDTMVTYNNIPSTFTFAVVENAPPPYYNGGMIFNLQNDVHSFDWEDVNWLASTSIVDGIPGESADYAMASVYILEVKSVYLLLAINLYDPSGEFIGPNGDGDPSNVQISADYEQQFVQGDDSGTRYSAEFTSIPEPSSIVLVMSGTLLVSAVSFARWRRRQGPYRPR